MKDLFTTTANLADTQTTGENAASSTCIHTTDQQSLSLALRCLHDAIDVDMDVAPLARPSVAPKLMTAYSQPAGFRLTRHNVSGPVKTAQDLLLEKNTSLRLVW